MKHHVEEKKTKEAAKDPVSKVKVILALLERRFDLHDARAITLGHQTRTQGARGERQGFSQLNSGEGVYGVLS
jgi:hypothetical protein